MANEQIFRPTLLVGVGGTGCRIAENVFRRARETGVGMAGRVQVLGFDTDENDMRRRSNLEGRQKVRFSSNFTLEEILERHPEIERDWFVTPRRQIPMEIRKMTLLDGAGQVRMLSRLALHEALSHATVEPIIGSAVSQLAQHDNREGYSGAIHVLMVGSLAGATGSGSFLQIALLLSEVCSQRNIEASVRGLFLMPDIYVRSGRVPVGQIPNVLANGYASFKEFHAATMKATERGGRYDFDFEYAPGRHMKAGDLPFISLTTIDYEDMQGGNLGRSIEAYSQIAERAAYTLLFTPVGSKMESVVVNDARQLTTVSAKGTHNRVAAIGLAAVEYPKGDIVDYLGAQLARAVGGGGGGGRGRRDRDPGGPVRPQRAAGNLTVEEPDQAASFLEDMRQLALDDQQAFFRELWQEMNPSVRDEQGEEEVQPLHKQYLAALDQHVVKTFWNTEDLEPIASRRPVDSDQFTGQSVLTEQVRRLENRLDDDLRRVDAALVNRPHDVFINLMSSADDMGEGDWRGHHLQTYLIRSGPHLVRNRAFLYALRQEAAKKLEELQPDETRKRLFRLANAFDSSRGAEPTTRGTPAIMSEASAVAGRGMLGRLVKGGPSEFTDRYVTYHNGSIKTLRDFAEQRLRQRVYERLLQEVDEQLRVMAGLFLEIEGALETLDRTVEKEERKHEADAVANNVLYVCANAASKKALWEELRDAAGGQRLGPIANRALAGEVYAKARRNRRARRPESLEDLKGLFWNTVVEGFAKARVAEDFRTIHDMTVVEAIRKESEIAGTSALDRLRQVVQVAERQSEPLVTLRNPTDGQRIRFWALHPELRQQLRGIEDADQLFNPSGQGTQPVEEPEFNRNELLCVTLQVNLELAHLAKLSPPLRADGSAANERAGRYYEEYAKMVDELIEAAAQERTPRTFTPHIHRDWHKPGILPEIADGITRNLVRQINRGFVAALLTEALRFEERHGKRVAELSTAGRVATNSVNIELADTYDMHEVLRAFERRPEAVRGSLRLWESEMKKLGTKTGNGAGSGFDSMFGRDVLDRLLKISESRQEASLRDARLVDLVAAHADLLTEALGASRPDLPERPRLAAADEKAQEIGRQSLERMKADLMPETVRVIETTHARGLERWREGAGLGG